MFCNHKKWLILIPLFVATLATSMGWFITPPLAPFLLRDLGLSKAELGILSSAPCWGVLSLALFSGWAVDKIGEKKMLILGPAVIAVATLAYSFGSSLYSLMVAGFFIGIGYSTITPLTNRAISTWFPPHQMAFAIGLKQTGFPMGAALAAVVIPHLSIAYGYHASSRILALLIFVVGLICSFSYQSSPTPPKNSTVTVTKVTPPELPDSISLTAVMRSNIKVLFVCLMGMGFCMIQIAIMTFLIPYFTEELAFSAVTAGYFLAIAQLGGAVSRPLFGLFSGIIFKGAWRLALIVLASLAICMSVMLSLLSPNFPKWLLALIVWGAGFTSMGWFGPFFALLTEIMGTKHAGLASGLGATFNSVGLSIGSPLFGLLVDATGSYAFAFQIFAVLILIATLIFFFSSVKRVL